MPRFAFTSSDSVFRVTPKASATCVMFKPEGSMHSCNTTTPGCGGFFMVMCCFLSVVVNIINILRVTVKTENYPPVGSNGHRPKAFQLAFEPMQPKPRHVHVFNGRRCVKRSQNIPQLVNVFRVKRRLRRRFQKTVSALYAGTCLSSGAVTCHVANVNHILAAAPLWHNGYRCRRVCF
jgi:hypothetical protein